MDEILNGKSIKVDFEAQVTAALMIQSNALLIPNYLRVFNILCQPVQTYKSIYASSRPGKWIANCDKVRFQF